MKTKIILDQGDGLYTEIANFENSNFTIKSSSPDNEFYHRMGYEYVRESTMPGGDIEIYVKKKVNGIMG